MSNVQEDAEEISPQNEIVEEDLTKGNKNYENPV